MHSRFAFFNPELLGETKSSPGTNYGVASRMPYSDFFKLSRGEGSLAAKKQHIEVLEILKCRVMGRLMEQTGMVERLPEVLRVLIVGSNI